MATLRSTEITMNTDLSIELPDTARIWVYIANRPLSNEEVEEARMLLGHFLNDWTAHGAALTAAANVFYNRFIVISVDEEKALASGCSIDKSVHFMKSLGETLNVDFFDRMLTPYLENEIIQCVGLHQFWALRKAGVVSDETIVFNPLVKSLGEFRHQWMIPFKDSWHAEMWK